MNILWISLYPPLPLDFGGPIGIYNRLKQLSKYNRIFLFYINEEKNYTYDLELSSMCVEVHSYTRNKIGSLSLAIDCIRYPYTVATRHIIKMKKDIEDCLLGQKIDLINVEFPQMCINLLCIKNKFNIPVILQEHNNEWDRFMQMASSSKGIRKIVLRREANKLLKFEKKLEKKLIIDAYSFLSIKDMCRMKKTLKVKEDRMFLTPLGAEDKVVKDIMHEGKNFMFLAAMDSQMNEEAAIWFCKNVFPKIKNENIKFYIVGRNPSSQIQKLASDQIIVTGTVDSLDYYYGIADAIVIPLLHGGGVKVKLLEAIGHGKVVITTTVGLEGTLFTKDHLYIADDAEIFAEYCRSVIYESEEIDSMKKRMLDLFRENYLWENIGIKCQKNMELFLQ